MVTKKAKRETVIIVLPAYNEEKNIADTITAWCRYIKNLEGSEILVLNDGSTDKTESILKKLTLEFSALKVVNKKNEGHGKTLIAGYKLASNSKKDWVFQTDSDGHFHPNDFNKLWKYRTKSDFILARRHKRKEYLWRIFLSKSVSIFILVLFGKWIPEPNVPFRLIKRNYLKTIIKKIPDDLFAPNIFLSILASKDGNNLVNIPVKYKRKPSSTGSIKIFKGALLGLKQLIHFKFSNISLF